MFRKKIAWILFISMIMVGLGYFIIGVSPLYWALLFGVAIIGFGTSLWHAPAFGTLAARSVSYTHLTLPTILLV